MSTLTNKLKTRALFKNYVCDLYCRREAKDNQRPDGMPLLIVWSRQCLVMDGWPLPARFILLSINFNCYSFDGKISHVSFGQERYVLTLFYG